MQLLTAKTPKRGLSSVYSKRYDETVISVAFSPDGAYFAAGGASKLALVWRVDNGELIHSFDASETITSIVFLGQGAPMALIAGTFDKCVHAFGMGYSAEEISSRLSSRSSLRGSDRLFTTKFPGQVRSMAAASARVFVVGGTDRRVNLYHPRTRVRSTKTLLASCGSSSVTDKKLVGFDEVATITCKADILSLALDSSGETLVVGGECNIAEVWYVFSTRADGHSAQIEPKRIHQIDLGKEVHGISLAHRPLNSGGGLLLALGSSESTELFSIMPTVPEATDGSLVRVESLISFEHAAHQGGVALSCSGDSIAIAGEHTVTLLDTASGAILRQERRRRRLRCVALSPDAGMLLIGGFDQMVQMYPVHGGTDFHQYSGSMTRRDNHASTLALSRCDSLLVIAGGKTGDRVGYATIYDARSHQKICTFETRAEVRSVCLSPDGRWLALAGFDSLVTLHLFIPIRRPSGEIVDVPLRELCNELRVAASMSGSFDVSSADGRVAPTTIQPPSVQARDVAHQEINLQEEGKLSFIWDCAFSGGRSPSDGRGSVGSDDNDNGGSVSVPESTHFTNTFAVASWNGSASVYTLSDEDDRWHQTTVMQRSDRVYCVSLSHDGSLVVVGGRDSMIGLYETRKGRERWRVCTTEYVYVCKLSQEVAPEAPRFCVYGGPDKVLTILSASTGSALHRISMDGTIWSIALGKGDALGYAAVSGESNSVRIIELESAREILPLPRAPLKNDGNHGDDEQTPVLSVVLTSSTVCYTQGNACVRYGGDISTYGWRDMPSYRALSILLREPTVGWSSLVALAKMQPAIIHRREWPSGATFLQHVISCGTGDELLDAILDASASSTATGMEGFDNRASIIGNGDSLIGLLYAKRAPLCHGGHRSAWHAALAQRGEMWISRLTDMLLNGRVHLSPAAMRPVSACFARMARLFPRQYLKLIGQIPLTRELSVTCLYDPERALRQDGIRVVGSEYYRLEGIWEDIHDKWWRGCFGSLSILNSTPGEKGGGVTPDIAFGCCDSGLTLLVRAFRFCGKIPQAIGDYFQNLLRVCCARPNGAEDSKLNVGILGRMALHPFIRYARGYQSLGSQKDRNSFDCPTLKCKYRATTSDKYSGRNIFCVPFDGFVGVSGNHLSYIVDAVTITEDRDVFNSPAAQALVMYKWRAFGTLFWFIHIVGWFIYAIASAIFAYSAVYFFSDVDSHWQDLQLFPTHSIDSVNACAAGDGSSGFAFLPIPPTGRRNGSYCGFYMHLAQKSFIVSGCLGSIFLTISAWLLCHTLWYVGAHASYRQIAGQTIWRLMTCSIQLAASIVVASSGGYDACKVEGGWMCEPQLLRLILSIGLLMLWLELIRLLSRFSSIGELYQMVIEAVVDSRIFLFLLLLICFMATLPLGLLLFDVHTVVEPGEGYAHKSSSAMFVLDQTYLSTATGPIDLYYNFGDIFRSFHSALDILLFGTKGDAVEAALLEVWPARYIAVLLQIFVQIILINLLIAKLSDAYAKIRASSVLASAFQQTLLLLEYEVIARHFFSSDPRRFPRWLHVSLPSKAIGEEKHDSELQSKLTGIMKKMSQIAKRQEQGEEAIHKRFEELRRAFRNKP